MENSEKQMTPEESLTLIGEVISNTRNNLKTDSFFFLLWGWFIVVASLLESVILWNAGRMNDWKNVGLMSCINWSGLVFIGLVIQGFYIRKHYVKRGYRTFFEKVISYLWIVSASIIFLMIYLALARHESPEPYILAVVSIPTFQTTDNWRVAIHHFCCNRCKRPDRLHEMHSRSNCSYFGVSDTRVYVKKKKIVCHV
jgi:hypothetical protein